MNLSNFGMDSITLAGPLEGKLLASRAAGFSQIMLWAKDLAGHPGGMDEAVRLVWREIASAEERLETARHLRVFPGEGSHSDELADLLRRLDRGGYRGDYSFEVFNDDYQQLPLAVVAQRAHRSAKWVTDQVLRRSLEMRRRTASHPTMA